MPLYIAIHSFDDGVAADDVAKAHMGRGTHGTGLLPFCGCQESLTWRGSWTCNGAHRDRA